MSERVKRMNGEQVRAMLAHKAEKLGSQKALASAIGVSASFINDILQGKREPSGKPVEFLGLERRVEFVPRKH